MVFFTCNGCGAAVKKNQVEKHFMQCRSQSLSCTDCQKDFSGNAYKDHNMCMTEDQKYGGLNYQPKESANKNLKKQERWVENFRAAAANAPRAIAQYVERIAEFENIPRKKPKFFNFLKSSLRIHDNRVSEQIWSLMEAANKAEREQSQPQAAPEAPKRKQEEDVSVADNGKVKTKKAKLQDSETLHGSNGTVADEGESALTEQNGEEDTEAATAAFKWSKAVRKILKQAPAQTLSFKKLRKQLKAEFEAKSTLSISKAEIREKLKSITENMNTEKYEVGEDNVKLIA